MKQTPSEKQHAVFSASGSSRWVNCPASIKLSEDAPPQTESPYAREGTDAHFCLESILKAPKNRFGVEARLRSQYPEEMVDHAAQAADWILNEQKSLGGDLLVETKVDASAFTREGEFGTLDAAIVNLFDTLHVIDFKYGVNPVDPISNPQMIYYALALSHAADHNFEKVKLTIYQPRAGYGEPVQTWATDIHTLAFWAQKFKAAVKVALGPNPPFKAGDHCKYCPAKSICPEISTKAFKEAALDFEPVIEGQDLVVAKGLPAERIGKILSAADSIETYLAEVRAQAFARLQAGEKIPGWKLVPKRASRKWANPEKTEKEALKAFGEMAFDRSLKSPAQLEKMAADAPKWVEKRCVSISSGDTLAPETDSREASKGIAQDFEPVIDEPKTKKESKKNGRKN